MSTALSSRPAGGPVHVPLTGGTLTLDVARSRWALDDLCAFAERLNKRRAFLIVSRVLGRHIPARPSTMRAAMRDLADLVPGDLPEPILVVGLAETAICLGAGLHEELSRRLGRKAVFAHSTRQRRHRAELCEFAEPHSHAARHLFYRPEGADLTAIRSVVLVDDEISTGTTLANLAAALVAALPGIEAVAVATLTDWSGGGRWLDRMPRPACCVSLLSGRLQWAPRPGAEDVPDRAVPARSGYGRLDRTSDRVEQPEVALPPGQAVRIVGTGEFTYPPFLLGERLERAGHDVVVHATSRSPVQVGGAIANALGFRDNYGADAPNYLYNALDGEARSAFVCHETPPGTVDPALLEALHAQPLYFEGR